MSNKKLKVLLFDDDEEWLEQIKILMNDKYDLHTTSNMEDWQIHIGGEYWDAIVVDVQILGAPESGTERARKDIVNYRIVAPIIVVSGAYNVKNIQKKYPNVFFDFIDKSDVPTHLSNSIDKACQINHRVIHTKKMLFALAKNMLKEKFSSDELSDIKSQQMFGSANEITVKDLINKITDDLVETYADHTAKKHLDHIAKKVLTKICDKS